MSLGSDHTYGDQCRLAPVPQPKTSSDPDGIPPLRAHFFYSSLIPIDDPLSTASIPGAADPRSSRAVQRPFSLGDSNALEKAWLALASETHRRDHLQAQRARSSRQPLSRPHRERLDAIIRRLAAKHKQTHDAQGWDLPSESAPPPADPLALAEPSLAACCQDLFDDVSAELSREFCALFRKQQRELDEANVGQCVLANLQRLRFGFGSDTAVDTAHPISPKSFGHPPESPAPYSSSTTSSPAPKNAPARAPIPIRRGPDRADPEHGSSPRQLGLARSIPVRPPAVDDGISGTPFIRVRETDTSQFSPPASLPPFSTSPLDDGSASRHGRRHEPREDGPRPRAATRSRPAEAQGPAGDSVDIAVGISRLHMVSLPALQMKPIYWSPVNDISIVLRATWFYKDGMIPIEPAVANQLEVGYRELCPWTETWADELASALEVGALGEEKVSHRLWPEPPPIKRPDSHSGSLAEPPPPPSASGDIFCAARCSGGATAAVGSLDASHAGDKPAEHRDAPRTYPNYHVLYKNQDSAFLLKPSLKPSAYYGRRPLAKIMKGITVGVPVVRGFDWPAWERLSEKKPARNREKQHFSAGSMRVPRYPPNSCPGCRADKERAEVTDLVLVIHGIGQKFAERVESFHFTHAINAFRRAVNVELQGDAVRSVLRDEQRGIMVLPINWRHVLSLEDGGPAADAHEDRDRDPHAPDRFSLKDIEPDTIPAVRSMISDVMFDIPFYMSHHKPKMIAALVGEANRVYRLWCRNNPSFSRDGRVHLIAHSLGSAMSVEVLSRQPTYVMRPAPEPAGPMPPLPPAVDHFEFDTTNLFFLGSPAGFFLLLERGCLLPRRGRLKPGADPADVSANGVVGNAGTFGCLAVDNIYNILAREDPIAYLLNGTIDPRYAAGLKVAYVPSATTSLLRSVGDAMRGIVGLPAAAPDLAAAPNPTANNPSHVQRPPFLFGGFLPPQLELEVHDFSREETAEKKAHLLNDNGQIDWYLRSGGGPLEIQYLNMLSAHTSYWVNQDLVRLLCVEIGRRPGRAHTLPAMRAAKSKRHT